MKQDIVNHVSNSDRFVNFAEMSRRIDGFSGTVVYGASAKFPHRVIWPNMSEEAIALIEDIDGSGVFLWPGSVADYAIEDRLVLPVPDETSTPNGFSEETDPFWLPMVFWKEPY